MHRVRRGERGDNWKTYRRHYWLNFVAWSVFGGGATAGGMVLIALMGEARGVADAQLFVVVALCLLFLLYSLDVRRIREKHADSAPENLETRDRSARTPANRSDADLRSHCVGRIAEWRDDRRSCPQANGEK